MQSRLSQGLVSPSPEELSQHLRHWLTSALTNHTLSPFSSLALRRIHTGSSPPQRSVRKSLCTKPTLLMKHKRHPNSNPTYPSLHLGNLGPAVLLVHDLQTFFTRPSFQARPQGRIGEVELQHSTRFLFSWVPGAGRMGGGGGRGGGERGGNDHRNTSLSGIQTSIYCSRPFF
jgi:hypothetical protein